MLVSQVTDQIFWRRFGSYSSYASYTSYGWCHRIFGSKGQVTQVMQVTRQFFFGEGQLVTVVTVVMLVTQVTDGVQDFLGGKAKLRSYNSFTSYWQKKFREGLLVTVVTLVTQVTDLAKKKQEKDQVTELRQLRRNLGVPSDILRATTVKTTTWVPGLCELHGLGW